MISCGKIRERRGYFNFSYIIFLSSKEKMDNFSNTAKLKVVGVGGAGGNAINDMIESNITSVDFIAINTDQQDLDMGAGADPEKGRIAAKESEEKIKEVLEGTDMLFITAGMGGGTGTGASPIIAEVAKAMGILTVAIVTKPFSFEGPLKKNNAATGINNLRENVDTLIAIPNDRLFEIPGMNISLMNAFKEANGVLKMGIKGISDLITKQGIVNLDFADIKSIMQNSGIAMLGFGEANGDEKAKSATAQALNSPLLEKSIEGARKILINVTAGPDIGLQEIQEVAETIAEKAGNDKANLIWGYIMEPELEGTISVSLVATDFQEELLARSENIDSRAIRFAPPKKEEVEVEKKTEEKKEVKHQIEEEDHDTEERSDESSISDFVLPPFFEE